MIAVNDFRFPSFLKVMPEKLCTSIVLYFRFFLVLRICLL